MKSSHQVVASPDGALSFLFGIFALLIWYTSVRVPDPSELLMAGFLWLVLSAGAISASLMNMARGKMRGNVNLLASLLLGVFPGVNALVALGCSLLGFSYAPRILGLVYILGAIFCTGMVVVRLDRPLYRAAGTLALAFGLFFLGLGDLFASRLLEHIGGWCCFVFALYIFYYGLSVMYLFMDARLPQGPVLFHTEGWHEYEYELDEESSKAQKAHLSNFYSPAMILSFISAVFGLFNFVSAIWNLPLDEELAMGVLRLLLGTIHFMAALIILFQGSLYGNVTLIFAVCFALFSGGRKVINVFQEILSLSMASGLYGILQLFAGIYVAALVPAMKNIPWYLWLSYWLSALGLICFGLSELTGLFWLSFAGGWMFLVFALLHIYKGLSALLPQIPQGPMRK